MRWLLDTNVIISALRTPGTCFRLLDAAINEPGLQLVASDWTIEELRRQIIKGKTLSALRADEDRAPILSAYLSVVEWARVREVPAVCRDPADDNILACAVAGQADLIVSGDKDLLSLGTHNGIRIVTPAEAIVLLAA